MIVMLVRFFVITIILAIQIDGNRSVIRLSLMLDKGFSAAVDLMRLWT